MGRKLPIVTRTSAARGRKRTAKASTATAKRKAASKASKRAALTQGEVPGIAVAESLARDGRASHVMPTDDAVAFFRQRAVVMLATRDEVQQAHDAINVENPVLASQWQVDGDARDRWSPAFLDAVSSAANGPPPPEGPASATLPHPSQQRYWLNAFVNAAPTAMLDVCASLVAAGDVPLRSSVLVAIGDAISREVRKRVLLQVLNESAWNMTRVSDVLQMGGASNVGRMVRELGLTDELDAARARGLAIPGKHRSIV